MNSPIRLNTSLAGLKFFFDVTLDRVELMAKMKPVFGWHQRFRAEEKVAA